MTNKRTFLVEIFSQILAFLEDGLGYRQALQGDEESTEHQKPLHLLMYKIYIKMCVCVCARAHAFSMTLESTLTMDSE